MLEISIKQNAIKPLLNNEIHLRNNQTEKPANLILRIALVAGVALAFVATAVATEIIYELDFTLLGGIGFFAGLVGTIVGLFIKNLVLKTNDKWQEVDQKFNAYHELDKEINRQFANANEKKMEEIVKIFDSLELQESNAILSTMQLDQVLELVDETKLSISRQYELDKLYRMLVDKLGEDKTNRALQNKDIFPEEFKSGSKILSKQMRFHIVNKAINYFQNREALERIKSAAGAENYDKMLAQFDLDEIMKGLRKLDPATESAMLKCAQAIKADVDFAELIEKVKESAAKDLYLDDQYIEEQFHVVEKLQDLSEEIRQERRDRLQKVINQAFIVREMRNKGKVTTGDKQEVILLNYLGFNVNDHFTYFDKDSLYCIVKEVIKNQLQEEDNNIPLKYVRERVHLCALRARLGAAGLTDQLQIDKFQILHKVFKNLKKELLDLQKQCLLKLPEGFPLAEGSLHLKKLKRVFEIRKHAFVNNQILKLIFEDNLKLKRGFNSAKVSSDQLTAYLNSQQFRDIYIDSAVLEPFWKMVQESPYFVNSIAFFMKWGSFLKAELIQGLDNPNECLGQGVCWGNVQRMRLNAQPKSDLTLNGFIPEIHLKAHDRFLQGVHVSNVAIAKNIQELPDHLLAENGYQEDKEFLRVIGNEADGFDATVQQKLTVAIKKEANDLGPVNGWAYLSLDSSKSGHATLMRLQPGNDKESHFAWFIDPNYGLFSFEEGRTFEEANDLFCAFIKDLFILSYSDYYLIRAYKLLKN